MNRKYTAKHFEKLVQKLRENNERMRKTKKAKLPLAITTDVIVGFPGEKRKQFLNTVKLFKSVKFDMAYTAQYSPRFGTESYKMKDDVKREEKRKREEELTVVLRQTAKENNEWYQNKTVEVLVDGYDKKGNPQGKTRTSKTVVIDTNKKENLKENLLGKIVKVKITRTRDFGLDGKLI
jgi:tRNA-2-methylthio-N6-dimethylallyladenosine synthase